MQYKFKDYDKDNHELYKALTVKHPYAEYIADGSKTIEVRSKDTKHRGTLVITRSANKKLLQDGQLVAIVDLYKTKPLEELTPEEWEQTRIHVNERKGLTGYGWFLQNSKKIIEYLVKGNLGIWNLVMDKLDVIPYKVNLMATPQQKKENTRKAFLFFLSIFVFVIAIMIFTIWGLRQI